MKSDLSMSPEQSTTLEKMIAKSTAAYPTLGILDQGALDAFRRTRNRIVHYGFSPRDDEETASLLLNIGLPCLSECYRAFFDFDLLDGLVHEYGAQLRIALEVYQKAKGDHDLRYSRCFSAFSHLIRWSVRQSFMAHWENDASVHAWESCANWESCQRQKRDLESAFGAAWSFDCPICDEIETFVCELDEKRLEEHAVVINRAGCANCGLIVRSIPFLANALIGDEIVKKRSEILRAFGIEDR